MLVNSPLFWYEREFGGNFPDNTATVATLFSSVEINPPLYYLQLNVGVEIPVYRLRWYFQHRTDAGAGEISKTIRPRARL